MTYILNKSHTPTENDKTFELSRTPQTPKRLSLQTQIKMRIDRDVLSSDDEDTIENTKNIQFMVSNIILNAEETPETSTSTITTYLKENDIEQNDNEETTEINPAQIMKQLNTDGDFIKTSEDHFIFNPFNPNKGGSTVMKT